MDGFRQHYRARIGRPDNTRQTRQTPTPKQRICTTSSLDNWLPKGQQHVETSAGRRRLWRASTMAHSLSAPSAGRKIAEPQRHRTNRLLHTMCSCGIVMGPLHPTMRIWMSQPGTGRASPEVGQHLISVGLHRPNVVNVRQRWPTSGEIWLTARYVQNTRKQKTMVQLIRTESTARSLQVKHVRANSAQHRPRNGRHRPNNGQNVPKNMFGAYFGGKVWSGFVAEARHGQPACVQLGRSRPNLGQIAPIVGVRPRRG